MSKLTSAIARWHLTLAAALTAASVAIASPMHRSEAIRHDPAIQAAAPRAVAAHASEYFVAPQGVPNNAGTRDKPLDLATALSDESPAGPGDTIWLRGGVYRGPFASTVTGTATAPAMVAQYPGERAIIDGGASPAKSTLTINGSHTAYVGFEVTNSSPTRTSERGIGVHVLAPHTRLINLIVHDTGNGIGFWSPVLEGELYGNLIYNIGLEERQQGKGHSIYVQNELGTKRIVDNVMFNGYSYGIHAYTEEGHIDNLYFEGNVAFNHGILSPHGDLKTNILVGGWRSATSPTLVDNFTYYARSDEGKGAEVGYHAGCTDARIVHNYFAGGTPIVLRRCRNVVMTANTFYGPVGDELPRDFPDNSYRAAGQDATTDVFVRPNKYEQGRATIIVFNWEKRSAVTVDLASAGLRKGERFEIRDAQNYFGVPLIRGVYTPGRPFELPMTSMAAAQPVGGPVVTHTQPEFGVFIVQRRARPRPIVNPMRASSIVGNAPIGRPGVRL